MNKLQKQTATNISEAEEIKRGNAEQTSIGHVAPGSDSLEVKARPLTQLCSVL